MSDPPGALPPMPIAPPPARNNGLAVASLVLGILSIVLFFTVAFPIILGILAVIFGAIAWSKANQGAEHKGLAIAGLICGILGIVVMVAFVAAVGNSAVHFINSYTPSISPVP
jgi:hypothetical protein